MENGSSFAEDVYAMITGEEFISLGKSNEEIVDILYRVMLDRRQDPAGKATWITRCGSARKATCGLA